MPHLQIDVNKALSDTHKRRLTAAVTELFSEVMETGTDHVAVSIRLHGTYALALGRVQEPIRGIALINADIRRGRSPQQLRALALALMQALEEIAGIPPRHVYLTYTEHPGEEFHLHEHALTDWRPDAAGDAD